MSEHTDWMIRQRRLVSGKADGLLLQSEARMSEIKLPEPEGAASGICAGKVHRDYTAEQVRQLLAAERERALDAVAALATQSRDREERDIIGKCWEAIRKG